MLAALARRYAFGDLAELVDDDRVRALCVFGQRLLDLDAEDFGAAVPRASAVPRDLVARAAACHVPQTARERPRGALASLRPVYALLLEVIEARWRRREMSAVISALHIAAEYLPLLAWETVLGHAGDPARWPAGFAGPGSRFGAVGDRECAHNRSQQSAAERTLRVAAEPPPGWRAYLDRQHSHVAHALAVCAGVCRRPCAAVAWLGDSRASLGERCRVALSFGDSALVRLRHAAPVGHGFGVPSPEEVLEAWAHTREVLSRTRVGRAAATEDSYPLPGLPALVSAVAATPIVPSTLLADVAGHIAAALPA
ncbi:hypothetical protein D5H75_34725 [Bailinhaonella thermotolerans]|uniref:Uncharacterized protein n=1 Tax=Bailinhaonella thermotolerans TaxID=1070861 RepID=A0A3A4ATE5_9ACTN|nr:hypothetical protein D5H75_34725 [Bailinhaonella thermotolerans]